MDTPRTASSAETHASPTAAASSDERTVSPLPPRRTVQFRHEWRYDVHTAPSTGARGLTLCGSLLPAHVTELPGASHTPEPAALLTRCRFCPFAELDAAGQSCVAAARALSETYQANLGQGSVALLLGQLVHRISPVQLLGLVALLAPKVAVTLPETHSRERVAGSGLGKGSCHVRVDERWAAAVLRADRTCYHDRLGVWVAENEAARRQLEVFEKLMLVYRNGIVTGRPLGLMTVRVANNQRLGLPTPMATHHIRYY